jgi:hypothetical protein
VVGAAARSARRGTRVRERREGMGERLAGGAGLSEGVREGWLREAAGEAPAPRAGPRPPPPSGRTTGEK